MFKAAMKDLTSGHKILVAIDDPVRRMLIETVLSVRDLSFKTTAPSSNVRAYTDEYGCGIIILDSEMDESEQKLFTDKITSANPELKIVLLTSEQGESHLSAENHNLYYLTKPFKPADLIKAISALWIPVTDK